MARWILVGLLLLFMLCLLLMLLRIDNIGITIQSAALGATLELAQGVLNPLLVEIHNVVFARGLILMHLHTLDVRERRECVTEECTYEKHEEPPQRLRRQK